VNRALRAATMGVLLFSPLVLSACGAGQVTQTATQNRDKVGPMAQVGDISLRAVELAAPPGDKYEQGSDAELTLAIVNGGEEPDTLVGVSGTDFAGAQISASSVSPSPSAQATPSGSAAATPSGTPTPSGTAAPSGTAVPTSSAPTVTPPATTTPAPDGASQLEIPPQSTVFVGSGGPTITLTGLGRSLTTGQYLQVTFTFQKAGAATMVITVANPTSVSTPTETFNFNEKSLGE
jgi:copper(I)-binding protein